ncbi:hypothetical protein Agub_g4313 [Astrephomene gubernaculifera]|uniref:Uncharacterized protein n=1 Tax=Astrephomene gubernaculifera TaxID=47775 RepID=A0AAD3HJM5_9CHLO|nr:hypothetical protein Agub_g4313 [Astrephomene gubernaculifera]
MGSTSKGATLLWRLGSLATRSGPALCNGLLSYTAAQPALPQKVLSSRFTRNVPSRLLAVSVHANSPQLHALPSPLRALPLLERLVGIDATAAASQALPASSASLASVRPMTTAASSSSFTQKLREKAVAAWKTFSSILWLFFGGLMCGLLHRLLGVNGVGIVCGIGSLTNSCVLCWRHGSLTGEAAFLLVMSLLSAFFTYAMWPRLDKVPYTHRLHEVPTKFPAPPRGDKYVPRRPSEMFFANARALVGWWNQLLPADHPDVVRVRGVLQRLAAAAAAGRGGGRYDHMRADMPWAVAVVEPVVGASEEQLKGREEERESYITFRVPARETWLAFDYPTCVVTSGEDSMHEVLLHQRTLQLAGEDESLLAAALAHKLAGKLAQHEIEYGSSDTDKTFGYVGELLEQWLHPEDVGVTEKHRRTHEADLIAVHLLSEAGYDPAGMVRWLERIQEQEQREQQRKSPAPEVATPLAQQISTASRDRRQRDLHVKAGTLSKALDLPPVLERLERVQRQLRRMEEGGQLKPRMQQPTEPAQQPRPIIA